MPNIGHSGTRDLGLGIREKQCSSSGPNDKPKVPGIRAVAGAIFNDAGQVLIARRPDQLHQGGKWEFPGGKIESGEAPRDALRRELLEELGIHAGSFEPLIRIRHRYPDKAVMLDVWKVTRYAGEPLGQQGQPLAWSAPRDLWRFTFPAANHGILKALALPDVYLITPEPDYDDGFFLTRLDAALRNGVRLVQLRAMELQASGYRELLQAAIERCHAHGARLLVNGAPESAVEFRADGVHLNGVRLRATQSRPLPRDYLVAASCHGRQEIAHANRIDADLAVLSPVRATQSHPGAKPLGWRLFRELCADATMPVYALGGMTTRDVNRAKAHGGQGIAAIRALWREIPL